MNDAADDVVITRVFDAPREWVFQAWVAPERLRQWWAPGGLTVCDGDARPGGEFRFCFRTPDGPEFWAKGVYREIVPPERLQYVHTFTDAAGNAVGPDHYGMGGDRSTESVITVTLEDRGDQTALTLTHSRLRSTQERAGSQYGWTRLLDSLAELLEEMQ